MIMPNFLIVGAAKSGTTALYSYLKQHPQIYMCPVKETNFFAFEGEKLTFPGVRLNSSSQSYHAQFKTNIESYRELFKGVSGETAIGEACPSYLYIPKASERIKHYIPDVKLIVILRDPVERAYSNFLHHIRDRVESCEDFAQAIEEEEFRISNNWWWGFHYVRVGLYFEQLKRYFERFERHGVKVYLYEDLKTNPMLILQDIFGFLGVDETFVPDISTRYNATGIPKNKTLDALIKESNPIKTIYQLLLPKRLRKQIAAEIDKLNPLVKPTLSPELRGQLLPLFREDILKLQELIQRDLSQWLIF